ncbi:MAG: TIGR00296 family protein [Candidatus Helarchaeota archaeon]|nr:TIGR00296 family protein [Candidatus Helarchaeota archaeon]
MLSLDEGKFLVKLARKNIESYIKVGKKIEIPKDISEKLKEKAGVFVTLRKLKEPGPEKELRGCIGYPLPHLPLIDAVIESSISSATKDSRFSRVKAVELDNIIVEVSALTPPEEIKVNNPEEYLEKIKIGRDGLIVEYSGNSGLLLPQVPVDWKWDVKTYLEHLMQKAWLPSNIWKEKDVKISSFQAEIFEEETPRGEVVRREIGEC